MATTERRVEAARDLRRRQTPAEALLWSRLRRSQLGRPFRRQHGVGPFVVDFCCLPASLVVELDGAVHERPDVAVQDAWRSDWLTERGFRVVRFSNDDVLTRTDRVLTTIRSALEEDLSCR